MQTEQTASERIRHVISSPEVTTSLRTNSIRLDLIITGTRSSVVLALRCNGEDSSSAIVLDTAREVFPPAIVNLTAENLEKFHECANKLKTLQFSATQGLVYAEMKVTRILRYLPSDWDIDAFLTQAATISNIIMALWDLINFKLPRSSKIVCDRLKDNIYMFFLLKRICEEFNKTMNANKKCPEISNILEKIIRTLVITSESLRNNINAMIDSAELIQVKTPEIDELLKEFPLQ